MSDLIVIAFPDDATAFEARAEFVRLQKDYLIQMEDVVVVTRGEDGQVQLHVGECVDGLVRHLAGQPLLQQCPHLHPPVVALGHEPVDVRPGEHVVAQQRGEVDDVLPEPGGHAALGAGRWRLGFYDH